MAKYTLIASRDLFESQEAGHYCKLASDLNEAGNEVTFFLVQNGVMAARMSNASKALSQLAKGGVSVLADAFSLKERSIAPDRLAEGIQSAELDVVMDHLVEGRKVIWH